MNGPDIFRKLRLDNSKKALIINAPSEYLALLENVVYNNSFDGHNKEFEYDFVQIFASTQSELERLLLQVKNAGKYDCILWACYPKGTGTIKSDIKRDSMWKALGLINLRPVSQIAIDDTWSAMRGRPVVD